MAEGQLNATQQLDAAIQAINSGNATLEWRPIGSGEGSSYAQVLVTKDGTVFEDVQAKDLGGGKVQLVTSAPAGTGGNNPFVGITTSVNPSTGTVAPITSPNQVAIDYNPSKDNSILGLNHNQLMAAGLAAMGGLMATGTELGAAGVGGSGAGGEALSGIDLGGVGGSPNTWLGGSTYGAVPAALSSVIPAGAEAALSPVIAANAGSSVVAPVAAGTSSSLFPSIGSLTAPQIAQLAKAGINIAGLLGAGAAVKGITGSLNNTGGGGMLTQQDRSGISSGTANYSPEYYQAIQAKYNQMMPAQPRDVTTDLKSWYETKYAPKVA